MDIDFEKIIKDAQKDFKRTNILVLGKTGVGKSTLINSIFGEDLAKTGVGKPCTEGIKEYSKEDFPIHLVDTKGLELENYEIIREDLLKEIKTRKHSTDPTTHIHIAWYCISKLSKRIEDGEVEIIKKLSETQLPIIIVVTQSIDDDQEFVNKIEKLTHSYADIIEVVALPYKFRGGEIGCMGLNDLVSKTVEMIPNAQKGAFIAAQKVDMALKEKKCSKIILGAASAATAAGATPIPFSDALILAPIQIGMLASISYTMGLDLTSGFLVTLVSSATGVLGASMAGRAVVANLIKLIPGGGSLVGGVISGATAATLTTTMGYAYVLALKALITSGKELTAKNVADAFVKALKNSKK